MRSSNEEVNPYAQPTTELAAPPAGPVDAWVPVVGDEPLTARALLDLFFRPARFFSSALAIDKQPALGLVLYVVALATAIDRIEQRLVRAELDPWHTDRTLELLSTSWGAYWGMALGTAVVFAPIGWLVAGWWYRMRLVWSGAVDVDKRLARVVFVWVSLVAAGPAVLETVAATLAFESHAASDATWNGLLSIVFVFWSIVVSYRGATTAFPTADRSRALVWFGVLPAVLYALVFGVVFVTFLSMGDGLD